MLPYHWRNLRVTSFEGNRGSTADVVPSMLNFDHVFDKTKQKAKRNMVAVAVILLRARPGVTNIDGSEGMCLFPN